MLILGISTSTGQVGCAVGGHEGVIARFEAARGRRHAEVLVPAIEFTLQQIEMTLDEMGCIAVDVGPGLFTGLRVGVATAKAIAHALRVPLIGVPSLDLLAMPVRQTSRVIVTVIDARRGEVFYAFYRQSPGGVQRVSSYLVGKPDNLAAELATRAEETLLVGDGAVRHRDHFVEVRGVELADQSLANPSAGALVQLAHAKALREDWVQPSQLEPLYLRKPDAEINWSTRAARETPA